MIRENNPTGAYIAITVAMKRLVFSLLILSAALCATPARADNLQPDPAFNDLIARLEADGFDPETLRLVFTHPDAEYDPGSMGTKLRALYNKKYVVRPPKPKPKKNAPRKKITLEEVHLTVEMLTALVSFKWEYGDALKEAEEAYNVPESVLLSILIVETKLGTFLGTTTAFKALAGMAAADEFSDVEYFFKDYGLTDEQKEYLTEKQAAKAEWAYGELKALLTHAHDNNLDPVSLPGSVYGAIGLCQFMPSNAIRLGVDGDGDGVVDLFNPVDAIHSIGRFLKNAGWKNSLSDKKKRKVIMAYNADAFYAKTVMAIAGKLAEFTPPPKP